MCSHISLVVKVLLVLLFRNCSIRGVLDGLAIVISPISCNLGYKKVYKYYSVERDILQVLLNFILLALQHINLYIVCTETNLYKFDTLTFFSTWI